MNAQRHRGTLRQVDAPHAMRRLAVVHPHHHRAAGRLVGHPHDRSQRNGAVRGRHAHRVIMLAAGGDIRRPLPVVPGGLANLQQPLSGRAAGLGLALALALALAEARGEAAKPIRHNAGVGGQRTGKRVDDQSSFDEHASCVPDVISRSARSRMRDVLHRLMTIGGALGKKKMHKDNPASRTH
jgi:hypothetical protein